MGEVVVSSSTEGEEEMVVESGTGTETKDIGSSEVVRWEKFLPRMVLRVLLVEADDSTRQIIAALLRKCSYRVAAVPDGLMAWETLKGRPHTIDLILTEVELPSISGYALLTLVMEHDVCKNIPVIMMSSHDSISMVLKCMLKGAADFLIKPVRRNELRNLWQHVWRRQTLTAGQIPQNSENNAASNHSSGCATSLQKNEDCSQKESDAQGLPQLNYRSASNLSNADGENYGECAKLAKSSGTPNCKTGERSNRLGLDEEPCHGLYNQTALRLQEEHTCARTVVQDESPRPVNDKLNANILHGHDFLLVEPSSGAIDLIGTFNNGTECTNGDSGLKDDMKKFEFTPQLELSLTRLHPSSSNNQGIDERHALNHSNASAFSWYNSKALKPLFPTSTRSGAGSKGEASKSPEMSSNKNAQNISIGSHRHDASLDGSQEIMTSLVIGQSGKAEVAYPSPQLGLIPVPGMRFDVVSTGYGHALPPVYFPQSSAAWSPKLASGEQSPFLNSTSSHSYPEIQDCKPNHQCSDETTYNSADQNVHQENNVESVDDLRHGSPAAGQSTSSSLCNSVANHNNGSGYGSFCNRNDGNASSTLADEKVLVQENLKYGVNWNQNGIRVIGSLHSSRREAALTKFRLKRKDRCYEKKVRYQSRKRLAEQRPRVKGQFVRQVQNHSATADANG